MDVDAGEVIYRIKGDNSDIKSKINSVNNEVDNFSQNADNASKSTAAWADMLKGNLLADAIKSGLQELVGKLAEFAEKAIEVGKDFDSAMSQVAATMGTVRGSDDFELLSRAAEDMGARTKYTAAEAAEALNYLALAGYNAQEAVSALPVTLNLAQAGGMDLARASDMITDGMTALGLASEDAAENLDNMNLLTDQMAVTAQKSNTSVSQLGDALLAVGANARELNGGTAEASLLLGVLADNGTKAAEAGHSLKNIIISLTTKADDFRKIGVDVADEYGKLRALPDIFADINKALDGMSDIEKNDVLNGLFNKYDITAVKNLLGTDGKRFEELAGYISECDGAAAQMAQTMNDNLEGALASVSSASEAFAKNIYDNVAGSLKDGASAVADALRAMTGEISEAELSSAVANLGGAVSAGLDNLTDVISSASEELVPVLLESINKQLPSVSENAAELILAFAQGLINALPYIAEGAAEIVIGLANGISDCLPELIPAAVKAVSAIAQGLAGNVGKLIETAGVLVTNILVGLEAAIPDILEFPVKFLDAVADGLINYDWAAAGRRIYENLSKGLEDAVLNGDAHYSEKMAAAAESRIGKYSELTGQQLNSMKVSAAKTLGELNGALIDFENGDLENIPQWIRRAAEGAGKELDDFLYDQLDSTELLISELETALGRVEGLAEDTSSGSVTASGLSFGMDSGSAARAEEEAKKHFETMANAASDAEKSVSESLEKMTDDEAKHLKSTAQIALANGNITESEYYDTLESIANAIGAESSLYDTYKLEVAKGRKSIREEREKQDKADIESAEKAADEAQKKADEAKKQAAEAEKNRAKNEHHSLEIKHLNGELDDSGYYNAIEALMSTMDAESDLYRQYEKEVASGRKSIREEREKQDKADIESAEKAASDRKDALEKAYNSVINARDSLADSMKTGSGIFKSEETRDKGTGEKSTERSVDISAFERKVKAREKLTGKISELLEKDTPDELINELLKADPEDALVWANELLKNPDKLSKVSKLYKRDENARGTLANMVTENSEDFAALGEEAGNVFGESFAKAVSENWEDAFDKIFSDEDYLSSAADNAAKADSSASAHSTGTGTVSHASGNTSDSGTADTKNTAVSDSSDKFRILSINGAWLADVVKDADDQRKTREGS